MQGEQLLRKGSADIEKAMLAISQVKDNYRWDYYGEVDGLRAFRKAALAQFYRDYEEGRFVGRYVQAALPKLPFADGQFDLVLSAHFLFTYSDRLNFDFHVACLKELCRVSAGEVRIYPLVGPDSQPYARLDDLMSVLQSSGIRVGLRDVPFEFQRGANQMLWLLR